jgi:preprotein translocase subunit SecF
MVWSKLMEVFNSNKVYPFMQKRFPFMALSAFLFVASLVLIFTKGLNFGIDFTGGTLIQVQYEQKAPIEEIRNTIVKVAVFEKATVTKFGSENEVVVRIPTSSTSIQKDIGDELRETLKTTGKFEIRRVDMVGPKVGDALQEKGLMALSLALLVILIYVSFRFEWRFAIASVLALVHDVTITIGFIVLFDVDVNLDILAALLTLLGYSINDTIIVFDRIREGLTNSKEDELGKIIDESVSNTLSRTTLTSLTTFFVVLTLFLFGGEIIYGFSFALLVGIIVGTYSSIFIASPLLMQFGFNISDYRNKEAQREKERKEKERMRAQFEQGTV